MKRPTLLYSVIIAALIFLYGYFAFLPQQQQQQALSDQKKNYKSQLLQLERVVLQMPTVLRTRDQLHQKKSTLHSRLFAKADVLHLFEEIEQYAKANRLELIEITPPVHELLELNRLSSDPNQPLFINVEVRLSGGFIDFGRFVYDLETDNHWRGLNRCLLTGSRDGTRPLQLVVGFKALLGEADSA